MTKVHEDNFRLMSNADFLSEYQWNMKIARHFFCGHCGIYTFHKKRAQPDHYGVNVFCLDDFDPRTVPVRATKGNDMTVDEQTALANWPGPRI